MTKEGKKNKARPDRARNQRRDPSSGRFTRASATSGTGASVEGVPPGEDAAGVENMVRDVPPGFKMVNPKGVAGAVNIGHDVPPGFETVTPKGAAGSSSSLAVHKVQSLAFSVHIVQLL
jgi:hypothetical protein